MPPPDVDLAPLPACEQHADQNMAGVPPQLSNDNTELDAPLIVPPPPGDFDVETKAKLDMVGDMLPQRVGVHGRVEMQNGEGEEGQKQQGLQEQEQESHDRDRKTQDGQSQSTAIEFDLSNVDGKAGGLPDGEDDVHGLQYPPQFLDSLPVLHPPVSSYTSPVSSRPSSPSPQSPHTPQAQRKPKVGPAPIRGVSAVQLAEMHERYMTTHAPDSVIFPFLHGLEGDNDAQNAFFVGTSAMTSSSAETDHEQRGQGGGRVGAQVKVNVRARVPRFRGLVWVASDEDDVEEYEKNLKMQQRLRAKQNAPQTGTAADARQPSQGGSEDDEDDYLDDDLDDSLDDDDLEDEDEDLREDDEYSSSSVEDESDPDAVLPPGRDVPMDIDVDVVGMDVDDDGRATGGMHDGTGAGVVPHNLEDHGEGAHMHPVQPRMNGVDGKQGGQGGGSGRPALSAIDTGGAAKGTFCSRSLCVYFLFSVRVRAVLVTRWIDGRGHRRPARHHVRWAIPQPSRTPCLSLAMRHVCPSRAARWRFHSACQSGRNATTLLARWRGFHVVPRFSVSVQHAARRRHRGARAVVISRGRVHAWKFDVERRHKPSADECWVSCSRGATGRCGGHPFARRTR
jgi:hypothetical protein